MKYIWITVFYIYSMEEGRLNTVGVKYLLIKVLDKNMGIGYNFIKNIVLSTLRNTTFKKTQFWSNLPNIL